MALASVPSLPVHRRHFPLRQQVRNVLVLVAAFSGAASFIPSLGSFAGHEAGRQRLARAAGESSEYDQYDWQRVRGASKTSPASSAGASIPDVSGLPDLPDFSEEEDEKEASLGAKVQTKEVSLPEIPGLDDDLMPPEPNPVVDGGLGFLEWTGLWMLFVVVVGVIGGGSAFGLSKIDIDPATAGQLLAVLKPLLLLYQILFFIRLGLTQFPRIKTAEMPWAVVHYPTEFILAPTRQVFKPEAGVDVAPVIWLLSSVLAAELFTGSTGVLQMMKDGAANKAKLGGIPTSVR